MVHRLVPELVEHRCRSLSLRLSYTVRDYGKPAERFSPAVTVVGQKSLVPIEDKRHEMRIYRGEYVHVKSSGAPSEAVPENWDASYDGDLDDDD